MLRVRTRFHVGRLKPAATSGTRKFYCVALRGCGSVQRNAARFKRCVDHGQPFIARQLSCDGAEGLYHSTLSASARGHTLPAELLRVDAQSPQNEVLRYAAHFLTRGCVIGIPTDTLYGLAADPFNLAAVDEIYRVKGRPETRALPILVNSLEQAMLLARETPRNFVRLAQEFWPGALTLVAEAATRLPLKVTAHTRRTAVRWPRSEV